MPQSVQRVRGDFASFAKHVEELHDFHPDVVVDMVPYYDKSGHGVVHFAGVASRAVVITSVDVYRAFARGWGTEPGPPDPSPLTEDAPLREKPSPDLGEEIHFDNVDVERAVGDNSALPTTVLRMGAIFGPGDPLHRLYRYVKRMDDRRPAIVLDARLAQWRFSRCYVLNAAEAVAVAAGAVEAAGRTYNVAAAHTMSEAEWVTCIAEAHGWSGQIMSIAPDRLPEQLRVPFDTDHHLVVDSSRIRAELSYAELISTHAALRDTIEWERQNPPPTPPVFDYDAEDDVLADAR